MIIKSRNSVQNFDLQSKIMNRHGVRLSSENDIITFFAVFMRMRPTCCTWEATIQCIWPKTTAEANDSKLGDGVSLLPNHLTL